MKTLAHIAKPCRENWNNMPARSGGRYCASCKKVVVDFTKMNDQELMNYLSKNSSGELCGNLHTAQTSSSNFFQRIHFRIGRSAIFAGSKKISLFFLGILIFISGCRSHVRGKIRTNSAHSFGNKNSSSISK